MKSIITQPAQAIGDFVSLLCHGQHMPWGNFSALGLVQDDVLIAGVVYNHYSGTNICMHVAAIPGARWLNRAYLHACFDYPFNQLGVRRVTGLVPKKNKAARRFDEHLGFKIEGTMRHALADDDMVIYGMLKENCRWLSVDSAKRYALAA